MREVTFHPEAEDELKRAAELYSFESQRLGDDFKAEVERLVRSILKNPEAGSLLKGGAKRRLCLRFPFGIIYRFSTAEVRILAVMQLHRRPEYWRGRR